MRATSAVLILAAASAAPVFSAPVSTSYNARRQTTGNDQSDALSLSALGSIFSVGAPIVGGIIDHFKNNGQQRREAMEILARAEFDESGAIKLGDAANIASIGSSVVSVLHSLFGGSNDQQRRDELISLLARAEQDDSGAISFSTIKDIGSIGASAVSILHNLFGGSGDNQQRDIAGLNGYHGIINHILKFPPIFSGFSDNQQRDITSLTGSHMINNPIFKEPSVIGGGIDISKLIARQGVSGMSQSDAIKLGTLSTIFSVGAPLIGGIIDHFKGGDNQQQRRELEELFARQDASGMSQSDAIKLGTLGTIFSVGAPIIGGIIDHFKGDNSQQQRREPEELFARQDVSTMSQSDAIKLGTLGTIFSVGAPIIGGIIDHFKGDDNQQQRRELEELLARFGTGGLDALD